MRIFGVALAFASLLLSSGGHWASLQVIALSGMLVEYSVESGIARGVEMTFDGEHPCPLCIAIEEGRQTERNQRPESTADNSRPFPKSFPLPPLALRAPSPSGNASRWSLEATGHQGLAAGGPEIPPPERT